jgi:hypothetical protein
LRCFGLNKRKKFKNSVAALSAIYFFENWPMGKKCGHHCHIERALVKKKHFAKPEILFIYRRFSEVGLTRDRQMSLGGDTASAGGPFAFMVPGLLAPIEV